MDVGTQHSWWVDHLDSDDNIIRTLPYALGNTCRIDNSIHNTIHGTGSLTFYVGFRGWGTGTGAGEGLDGATGGTGIDWQRDRLRVWMNDGLGEDVCLGTFLIASPKTYYTDSGVSWDVALMDKVAVLEQDKVPMTTTIRKGENVVGWIVERIQWAGETAVAATPSNKSLGEDKSWVAGTSLLNIFNDLLTAINYFEIYCNPLGQYVLRPYVAPAERPVVWEFVEGAYSHHSPVWTREQGIFEVPNRVVMSTTGSQDDPAKVAVAENRDPTSPYSYQARGGRWVTEVQQNMEADSQETLDGLARRKLIESSAPPVTISMSHQKWGLQVHDRVRFRSQGYDGTATVYTSKADLSTGVMIQTQLREV